MKDDNCAVSDSVAVSGHYVSGSEHASPSRKTRQHSVKKRSDFRSNRLQLLPLRDVSNMLLNASTERKMSSPLFTMVTKYLRKSIYVKKNLLGSMISELSAHGQFFLLLWGPWFSKIC